MKKIQKGQPKKETRNAVNNSTDTLYIYFDCRKLMSSKPGLESRLRITLNKHAHDDHKLVVGLVTANTATEDDKEMGITTSIVVRYNFRHNSDLSISADFLDRNDVITSLGEASFTMSQLMIRGKQGLDVMIKDGQEAERGQVTVFYDRFASQRVDYTLRISCKDVLDVETFSKSDPYVKIFKPKLHLLEEAEKEGLDLPEEAWERVYTTEYVDNNLNPVFGLVKIDSNSLCYGKPSCILKVEIWDYNEAGDDLYIGNGIGSVKKFQEGKLLIQTHGNVKDTVKMTGLVKIECLKTKPSMSMADYLRAGLQLNMLIGIDFTASNGHPDMITSLHNISRGEPNVYETLIHKIGKFLFGYDKDSKIPVYGFGGKLMAEPDEPTKDLFLLHNTEDGEQYAKDIDSVLNLYRHALSYVELSGPTRFEPLLNEAVVISKKYAEDKQLGYTVLLLITDGSVSDMKETLSALVDASSAPLSLMIVGVGDDYFEDMKVLDNDENMLKDSEGRESHRDMVQFVRHHDYKDMKTLRNDLLTELPDQIEDYFDLIKLDVAKAL